MIWIGHRVRSALGVEMLRVLLTNIPNNILKQQDDGDYTPLDTLCASRACVVFQHTVDMPRRLVGQARVIEVYAVLTDRVQIDGLII